MYLSGFLALYIFVVSLSLSYVTTLLDSGVLSCVMFSSRVCFVCTRGCRFFVSMSLVLSWVATPPILISPFT